MRRLMLASLAFLLLFLPFQVGGAQAARAGTMAGMDCCPCGGAPSCPPACPAPSPVPACAATHAPLARPGEAEAIARRAGEPSPVPAFFSTGELELSFPSLRLAVHQDGPPDRGGGQAKLSIFRI